MKVVRTLAASEGRTATASQERNAQRFVDKEFAKRDLSLPLDIEPMEHEILGGLETSISTYHIKPQTWLAYLLSEDPSVLAGPNVQDPGPVFEAFWMAYRPSHATHVAFREHGHDLKRVVPLYIHGDEGRSIKKTSYLVLSLQSAIGGTARDTKPCTCADALRARPDLPTFGTADVTLPPEARKLVQHMYTNYKGHSFLSRFLPFGVGGWIYKKNTHVLYKLFEELVQAFEDLFTTGILLKSGERFYGAIVGCKGDMDFFAKYFDLQRSYSKVIARNLGFICHECLATAGAQSQHGFEDFGEEPAWAQTQFTARPWSTNRLLANLPCDAATPERMLKSDPFHVVKLGLARDLIGGMVVVLARKGFWDHDGCSREFKLRWERAHSYFVMFCQVSRLRPGVRAFTKEYFHVKNFLSAPWSNSEGSDSMILLKFMAWFLRLNLKEPVVPGYESLLQAMLQTTVAVLAMFRILHSHRLFLNRACACMLYVQCMRVVRGFKLLSLKCFQMNARAFILKPKIHALHHIAYQLKQQLVARAEFMLSPEAVSCEVDEDFIGRVSRLSRRVNVRLCDRRVIQRVFLKTRALLKKRAK